MVAGTIFIGAIIAGITQWIKLVTPPQVSGHWIIPIAVVVGILVAVFDTNIGVVDISVAQGVMIALAVCGVVATAEKIG